MQRPITKRQSVRDPLLRCAAAIGVCLGGNAAAAAETFWLLQEPGKSSELRLAAQPVAEEVTPLLPPAETPPPVPRGGEERLPPRPEPLTPLLDGESDVEELPGSFGCDGEGGRGVRPYGGGHPTDWWGCGGSPYRTGPGRCDNWKVGPVWHVTADGIVLTREDADLVALAGVIALDDPLLGEPFFEQFDRGPGGRITLTSQTARHYGFDIQAAYEGVEEWNASIVYPKEDLPPPPPPFVIVPDPDTLPPPPFPEGFEQRSLHYRTSLHSGELNFLPNHNPTWRTYCGVRFIRLHDEINDFINQERQPPLPGPRTDFLVPPATLPANDPIGPTHTTDRVNLFDIQNHLMGFQIGLLHDTWRLNKRLAVEGFVNAGVYYNRVKYTNLMGVFTTQEFADNTRSTTFDEARVDFADVAINDVRELSEIAYHTEASLTGVCRLNRCWALRAGYQVLWINNVHLAEDAFLTGETDGQSLLFHGWHAGIECRR